MIGSYLKIALRHLVKYKAYSLINISGLAIGMACCIMIMLYVQDELSYDRYHENSDRIYRVTREWLNDDGGSSLHLARVAPPVGTLLKSDFPQIEVVRFRRFGTPLVRYEDKYFEEDNLWFADPEVFDVFSYDLVSGDPTTALDDPSSVVMTEQAAERYFGDGEAIGQVLSIPNYEQDFTVTGVMRDVPTNSHFRFELLASFKFAEAAIGDGMTRNWGSNNYPTYLLFPPGYDVAAFESQTLPDFMDRHLTAAAVEEGRELAGGKPSDTNILHLQLLTDIHLRSHLDSEIEVNGDITTVYILSAIAAFILLIACINYMNLSTARSANRAREVGMRKVVGASRAQLVRQFLGESVLYAFFGLVISLALVELTLPGFSKFVGKDLELNLIGNPALLFGLVAVGLVVGMLAGSYPAFFLSTFRPAQVLKGTQAFGSTGNSAFRKLLVVFQFAISIILIISMGVVFEQLNYCRNTSLGLDTERIVALRTGREVMEKYNTVKEQLLAHPGVVAVAGSKRIPSGRLLDSMGARVVEADTSRVLRFRIANIKVDHDYIDTYGLKIVAGRDFSLDFRTDSTDAFILNETAVKAIGWSSPEEAVGKALEYGNRSGHVIGVVNDFHYETMYDKISPVVIYLNPSTLYRMSVKIKADDVPGTLAFLEETWHEYRPNYPFSFHFIDDEYHALYQSDEKLGRIFGVFSALALFVACLGLFGLASFTAQQRTKEIGIRKVLGASVSGITLLLAREFTKLVVIATAIAWPVAYFVMNWWLGGFAYRIPLTWQSFVVAALSALAIAIVTVSFQSIRAATANPVESLRYE